MLKIDTKDYKIILGGNVKPKLEDDGIQKKNKDDVPEWVVPLIISVPDQRPETISATIAAHSQPLKGVEDFAPVKVKDLSFGKFTSEGHLVIYYRLEGISKA